MIEEKDDPGGPFTGVLNGPKWSDRAPGWIFDRPSGGPPSRAYWYEKNQWHWFGPLKHLCITSLRFQWCIIWSNCKNFRLSKILIFDEGKMHWNAQKSSDLDKAGFWSRRRRTLHGPKKVYFSWNLMWNLQTMPYSCEKNDEDGVKTCACSHRGPEWAFLAFEGLFNSFCTIVIFTHTHFGFNGLYVCTHV